MVILCRSQTAFEVSSLTKISSQYGSNVQYRTVLCCTSTLEIELFFTATVLLVLIMPTIQLYVCKVRTTKLGHSIE